MPARHHRDRSRADRPRGRQPTRAARRRRGRRVAVALPGRRPTPASATGGAAAGTVARPALRKVTDLTHLFRAGFPVYTGDEPTRRTLKNYVPDGFYSQEWTFGEHSGTHVDAPGHFVPGARRVPDAAPRRSARAGGRHRHQRARRLGPRRAGRAARPAALRAPPRPHPARRGRADGLGLGGEGQRHRGVQERRRGRHLPLPGLRDRRGRGAARPARHPGHRRRHAQPRPGQLDDLRRPQPAAGRAIATGSRTSPTCRRCAARAHTSRSA